MLASVIIEYSVKSLNKVFDYIVPEDIVDGYNAAWCVPNVELFKS